MCKDFETSPLPEKEKALFRYLAKVNDEPAKVDQAHIDTVLAAGWDERSVYDAATVCSMFNFFNRWIDATGVPAPEPGLYEQRLAQTGPMDYTM